MRSIMSSKFAVVFSVKVVPSLSVYEAETGSSGGKPAPSKLAPTSSSNLESSTFKLSLP